MKKTTILLTTVTVFLVIISYVFFYLFTGTHPWLFIGAYAVYYGSTKHPVTNEIVSATILVEIIDLNNTHAAIKTYFKLMCGKYFEEVVDTRWAPITVLLALPPRVVSVVSMPLSRKIYVKGLGVRECIVYEYVTRDNVTVKGYIDRETIWPILYELKLPIDKRQVQIKLKLVESNIPGLTKTG